MMNSKLNVANPSLSSQRYSQYDRLLIVNDTKQRKQKLLKKTQQTLNGGISTIENYYECCYHSIQGQSSIKFTKDITKKDCLHDINISDIRDLLIGCLTGKKLNISKCLQVSNAPFIRKIVHLHIDNCPSNEIAKDLLARVTKINLSSSHHPTSLLLGTITDDTNTKQDISPKKVDNYLYTDIQCIKIDKEIDFDGTLPYKLLTVPYSKASEISSIGLQQLNSSNDEVTICDDVVNNNTKSHPHLSSLDHKQQQGKEYRDLLLPYTLSPSQMHLWGYMVGHGDDGDDHAIIDSIEIRDRTHQQTEDIDNANRFTETIQSAAKRRKLIDDTIASSSSKQFVLGVNYGEIPGREEADVILAHCSRHKNNICTTIPTNSANYQKLWIEPSSDAQNHHKPLLVAAIDCELCDTANGLELTRITIIDAQACIILDSYVKPSLAIINYRTEYSGITEELLRNVTVTLSQVQVAVLRLISQETILIGHSLENDLKAIKIAYHPLCIDTSILYPHPRGFPLRLKLKKLTLDFLQYSIQSDNKAGHDSVEDARAALQLAILKAQNGPMFGVQNPEKQRISIFELIDHSTSKSYLLNQQSQKAQEQQQSQQQIQTGTKVNSEMNITATDRNESITSSRNHENSTDSILLQQCLGGNSSFSNAKDFKETISLLCDYLTSSGSTDNRIGSDLIYEVHVSTDINQGPIASWIVPSSSNTLTSDNNEDHHHHGNDDNIDIVTVPKVIYALANLQYQSSLDIEGMVSLLGEQISRISSTVLHTTTDSTVTSDNVGIDNRSSSARGNEATCGTTLLLITTQSSLEPVVQMIQRKRVSSKNSMSAMIWTAENEMKLKEIRKHNLAYLTARMI